MKKNLSYLLLADDDPDDREALIHAFAQRIPAADVICVENGQQLLHFLEQCPIGELPALILLDYKMPVLTAADILKLLEGERRFVDIPKYVWSTSTRPEFVEGCMQHGAAGYFGKPSTMSELQQMVDKITELFRIY